MPDCRTSHRHLTAIHQRVPTGGALRKEEKTDRATGGTLGTHATRRYVHPPGRSMQHEVCLPLRGLLVFPRHGKGLMAVAGHDHCGKPATMPPGSQRWRHTPGSPGERHGGDSNTFKSQCWLPPGYHAKEPLCFLRIITAWLGTKQPMEREGQRVAGPDQTKPILSTDAIMMASAPPAPCTFPECTTSLHDTVVNRSGHPGS